MRITLDASIKEHREIAELFRGSAVFYQGVTHNILAVAHYEKEFLLNDFKGIIHKGYKGIDEITIDLDLAQMDLRMAIGTDIEFVFVQQFVKKGTIYAVSSNGYAHMRSLRNKHIIDLDKIKLCPDYLKRIEVGVEEWPLKDSESE